MAMLVLVHQLFHIPKTSILDILMTSPKFRFYNTPESLFFNMMALKRHPKFITSLHYGKKIKELNH